MINTDQIRKISSIYGIKFKEIADNELYGAPSRAADRVLISDRYGNMFIIEKHHFWNRDKKEKMAENIEILAINDIHESVPYLKNGFNQFVTEFDNRCWMMIPFIENVPLKRPDYLNSAEMGKNAAGILLKIYNASSSIRMNDVSGDFSFIVHVHNLIDKIRRSCPDLYIRTTDVVNVVENRFIEVVTSSKIIFCHGDFHPLNILWENESVKSVIDWEFSGYRPILTDIANILGCAGFEDSAAFERDFVKEFLKTIENSGFLSEKQLRDLNVFIIGFRFAGWLNEWINDKDEELMEREICYLNFLLSRI